MVHITERGLQVLKDNPTHVDNKVLKQFPEFLQFQNVKLGETAEEETHPAGNELDPQESIEALYQSIHKQLADELIARIKTCSPEFFEKLVVELLVKMGFGGSRRDAGKAIGKAGDGGIDGVIKEDKLGLDTVFIQAKRWEGNVGSKEIQSFVGALHGRKARKGVFITTSGFSKPALEYVRDIQEKVILIDGNELADFLIEHRLGVSTVATYEIRKMDSDYFDEA